MKNQIANLFQEVEQKEKRRTDLEVEKLLYQINPHFGKRKGDQSIIRILYGFLIPENAGHIAG